MFRESVSELRLHWSAGYGPRAMCARARLAPRPARVNASSGIVFPHGHSIIIHNNTNYVPYFLRAYRSHCQKHPLKIW